MNQAKKCFTSANDNDYYCHAFPAWASRTIGKARHCSHCFQVLFSQLGCWLFFCLPFTSTAIQRQIVCLTALDSIE
ncbi:hypothetical protein BSU01_18900 [Erwinia billingiae]|nr:hypothetical protein [Erwinia billingiae]